ITVWVIAFGDAMTAEEQQCASSSGNAFSASSDTQLNSAFQTIASRVAMLRISK
ncbi:pilus assembly protein TadG, partial [Escherichia coli]|nr:pilus assembly protein TadG [Escherichia coli]